MSAKHTFTAVAIPIALSALFNLPGCYNDAKPQVIKSEAAHINCDMHEYQIELNDDTVLIYDHGRPVGGYITDGRQMIDTILLEDNQ